MKTTDENLEHWLNCVLFLRFYHQWNLSYIKKTWAFQPKYLVKFEMWTHISFKACWYANEQKIQVVTDRAKFAETLISDIECYCQKSHYLFANSIKNGEYWLVIQ
jgi:hypothetical protein